MKVLLSILSVMVVADMTRADVNYSIATGQARRDASQNNASQGVQPASPQSPSTPPPPMDPALAATMQNIADLRADFDVICAAADAATAADQRISLLNHLSAAAQGTKAPSADVRKTAGHLISALAGQNKISVQTQKLARDVHALFNGAHLSAMQQQALLDNVKKIFTDAGVSVDDAGRVIDDLTAIAADTK